MSIFLTSTAGWCMEKNRVTARPSSLSVLMVSAQIWITKSSTLCQNVVCVQCVRRLTALSEMFNIDTRFAPRCSWTLSQSNNCIVIPTLCSDELDFLELALVHKSTRLVPEGFCLAPIFVCPSALSGRSHTLCVFQELRHIRNGKVHFTKTLLLKKDVRRSSKKYDDC